MLEKLKQSFRDRIERDAVKSEMTYHINKGTKNNPNRIAITETVYIKRSKIPLIGDWARIYPPVNEDGSWNIINLIFGGKKNLLKLLGVSAIIAMVLFEFKYLFNYIEALKELIPVQILFP